MKTEIKQSLQAVGMGVVTILMFPLIVLLGIPFGIQLFWELMGMERPLDPLAPLHNPHNYE